ncbi:MAG TPA: hypothetical protein VKB52_07325 [Rhodanobacteraceae bacterium]|nr:hypothetical protein [Rhodanobacteraceae bacterium]
MSASALPDQIFFSAMELDTCPAHRIERSDVSYNFQTVTGVDVTRFENLWGRVEATDPVEPFPGVAGSQPTVDAFTRTGYVAAKFHTPSDIPSGTDGLFKNVSYGSGPALDFSLSPQCGDFSPALGACIEVDAPAADQGMVYWRGANGNAFYCALAPDTDYYANIRLHDPDDAAAGCSSTDCRVTTVSYVAQP